MKPSYTSTPRSMDTAVFIPSADPIEYGPRENNAIAQTVVYAVCLFSIIAAIYFAAYH
jgi:hypothetical protein